MHTPFIVTYNMDYTWDPDVVLHITDPFTQQIHCQGVVMSKSGPGLRCSRPRSNKPQERAQQLLTTLSHKPPSKVSSKQLNTLANLCLCSTHKDDEVDVAEELQDRLHEAKRSYLRFQALNTRVSTFHEDLCEKLAIDVLPDDMECEHDMLDAVQELKDNALSKDREIASLREKLRIEQFNLKQVNSEKKQQTKTVQSLGSRLQGLQNELKSSASRTHQAEQSLEFYRTDAQQLTERSESAEAQNRQLEDTCRESEAKAHQQRAELDRLKSEAAERERSSQELESSIANLQAQVQETKTLEKTLQHRVKEVLEALSQTEAQTRNFQQSNINLQQQLSSAEKRPSEQIEALTALHEHNLTAADQLATTNSELAQCQVQLAHVTMTSRNLELSRIELQSHIDEGKARADIEASKKWKVRIRNLTQSRAEASRQPREEAPLMQGGTAALSSAGA